MVQQGFFSGSASKSQRIANAGASTPVRIDTVTTGEGKTFQRVLPNFGAGRVGEIRLKKAEAEQKENKPFFSQRLAQNKVAQPLSEPGSEAFNKEIKQYEESIRKDLDFDMIDRYGTDELKNLTEEGKQRLEDSYKIYRQYNYDRNPLQYQQGVDFSEKKDEGNILTKTGNFIANIFTPPAVAGTLEGKPTRFAGEADPTPRPKLDYVNPDKTTMTGSEIRDAFRPSNLFGYKDKFGRYGEAVDRDRQQTMNQVSERYSSMPDPDARSLSQIRQDRAAKMKTDAEQRQARFKETGVQTFGVGVSGGKHAIDKNCERLKLARILNDFGMKVAAVAILCQDERVFESMIQAGTPCPIDGKIGKEAEALWAKYDHERPDYNTYGKRMKDRKKIDDEEARLMEEEFEKIEAEKERAEYLEKLKDWKGPR